MTFWKRQIYAVVNLNLWVVAKGWEKVGGRTGQAQSALYDILMMGTCRYTFAQTQTTCVVPSVCSLLCCKLWTLITKCQRRCTDCNKCAILVEAEGVGSGGCHVCMWQRAYGKSLSSQFCWESKTALKK